jgi:hypothetical protein
MTLHEAPRLRGAHQDSLRRARLATCPAQKALWLRAAALMRANLKQLPRRFRCVAA